MAKNVMEAGFVSVLGFAAEVCKWGGTTSEI
jgi:hypothetical protein